MRLYLQLPASFVSFASLFDVFPVTYTFHKKTWRSMRKPVCVKNVVFFFLVLVRHFASSRAASVAILPSALF